MASDPDEHDLNLLAAHLDGRLTAEESAQVMDHLAGCETCRATLARFARASVPVRRSVSRPAVWLPIAATLAMATTVTLVTLRHQPASRSVDTPSAAPQSTAPAASNRAAATASPPPSATTAQPPALVKRAGERTIGTKTFRLEAGQWVDTSYDAFALLPVVDAATPAARTALLRRIPALGRYASLGANVLVVYEGTVYRLGPLSAARR